MNSIAFDSLPLAARIEAREKAISRELRRIAKRPPIVREAPRPQRAAWLEDGSWQHHDTDLISGGSGATPYARRYNRTNADIVAAYGAVFSAIRKRSTAAMKAQLKLVRKTRGGDPVEILEHPALDALRRVNESMTYKQGMGLIEQHKLTSGAAYWIKRRNRLRVPVEFEIWNPEQVEIVPRKDKPWVPEAFKRHKAIGTVETVAPEDVVWFRHMIDPRNPLKALSPIGAQRLQIDTDMEAARFNQRFFDNNAMPAALLSAKDAGKGEVERIKQDLQREFKSTDNAHRMYVTEGDLTVTNMPISHKDMEFVIQHRMTKEDVAMVFEMNPIDLGDSQQATKENLDGFTTAFWFMMLNQLENTAEELNEFFIHPDFGVEFDLMVEFDVPALQPNKKLLAEIDAIYLDKGKVVINELRERDGEDPVAWGDTPIVSSTIGPLDTRAPAEKDAAKSLQLQQGLNQQNQNQDERPRSLNIPFVRNLEDAEADVRAGWERRLSRELRAIIAHLDAADKRALAVDDVGGYDWDWWARYGEQVMRELGAAYIASLEAGSFVATPLLPTHELASRYARHRAGELLELDGRDNVVKLTRARVRELVEETIREGKSLRDLKNKLRNDFAFSDARADTVARTETAFANGDASLKAYMSNGYEGKRWLTAGDERVDLAPCQENAAAGPIPLHQPFPSGHHTVPAHPNCRCRIVPVVELPRRTVKTLLRDEEGRAVAVEEVTHAL